MSKIVCKKCGDIMANGPVEKSMGIITCDKCKEQVTWMCDGEKVYYK